MLRAACKRLGRRIDAVYVPMSCATGGTIALANAVVGIPAVAVDILKECSDAHGKVNRAMLPPTGVLTLCTYAVAIAVKAAAYGALWPLSLVWVAERARRAVRDRDARWMLPPIVPLSTVVWTKQLGPYLFAVPWTSRP